MSVVVGQVNAVPVGETVWLVGGPGTEVERRARVLPKEAENREQSASLTRTF